MGNTYTSLAMRGDDRDAVVHELGAMQRDAFVAGPIGGWIVVLDKESEQDEARAVALGRDLTSRLGAPALIVRNEHDDALCCRLFQGGLEVHAFRSGRRCAVDAALLCYTLRSTAPPEDITRLLRRRTLVAVETHLALAEALGLPTISVGMGFYYARRGDALRREPHVELVATGSARVDAAPGPDASPEQQAAFFRQRIEQFIERAPPHRQAWLRQQIAASEAFYRQEAEEQERQERRAASPLRIVDDDE